MLVKIARQKNQVYHILSFSQFKIDLSQQNLKSKSRQHNGLCQYCPAFNKSRIRLADIMKKTFLSIINIVNPLDKKLINPTSAQRWKNPRKILWCMLKFCKRIIKLWLAAHLDPECLGLFSEASCRLHRINQTKKRINPIFVHNPKKSRGVPSIPANI